MIVKTKPALLVIFLVFALFAFTTMISADYTTDGDDSTAVDYIVMDAEDVKAASGSKGEIVYDENGYKVVKYTPSETWYSAGNAGQLNIYPGESEAGFAQTGENSLFDFGYYAVYYKTTKNARLDDTLNIIGTNASGSTVYKWGGKEQIVASTDYTIKVISLDTFVNGSDGTTVLLDDTATKQAIGLKLFESSGTDGYIYIESITAFRTEDQANDFKNSYIPNVSADYTTDGDDSTEVDYIIMNAVNIKAAAGNKGEVIIDENDYKTVKFTASETYYTAGDAGQLKIYPEKSSSGFAQTGENSFFDFPYYTIYYRTTSDSVSNDTTNLIGTDANKDTIYKWNCSETLPASADYTVKIIKLDSFTSGSDGKNEVFTNAMTIQAIGLKTFSNSSVDGELYIESIAAFRTEEQASRFAETYKPESIFDTYDDYLVIPAEALNDSVTYNAFGKSVEYDIATGRSFVRFTATEDGTHADGMQFEFNFQTNGLTSGYNVKQYPIVKIAYRSNVANTTAHIDTNYGLSYEGINTRIWGYMPQYNHDESLSNIIFDVSSSFNGGEGISEYDFSKIDDTSVCNYLRLKPWGGGDIFKDEYFEIEYIGFFKNVYAAENYTNDPDVELVTSFDAYKLKVGESIQSDYTIIPTSVDAGSVTYSSSNDDVATVSETGLITANGLGNAIITISAGDIGISSDILIIVHDNSPLDWYAIDSADGDTVTVNVIGDSISYGTGTSGKNSIYHGIWASDFKMNVNNWSRGGSSMTGDYKYGETLIETYVPRMERMVANDPLAYEAVTTAEDPDMIVIYGGTNDYNGNWTIGEPGDLSRDTFCGAISELIMLSWKNYPDAKLVFFTPIKRCDFAVGEGSDNTGLRNYHLEAYVEAMKATCEYYDVPCIDLYNNEQTNFIGLRTTYMKDGVHMTDEGHKIFAKVALEEMEKAGVIKTHGYTAAPAPTYTLDADRDLSAKYHIYDATALNTLANYEANTLIDRQRMTKHTLVDGALRFSAESLTSKIAPAVTVNFASLDFAITDYPYMSVVYKTDSTAANIDVQLRGADNHVSTIAELPALTSTEKAGFYVNVKDYESDDIVLTGDTINSDLYMTLAFFEDTYSMTADSYVDIESIAFHKNEVGAKLYMAELGLAEYPKATVTFKSGEETFAEIEQILGKALTYPETTPAAAEGEIFVGWDVEEGTIVTEAITVNAVFEKYVLLTAVDGSLQATPNGAYVGVVAKDDDGNKILHYTNDGSEVNGEWDRLNVTFEDVDLAKYPVMKVGYRSTMITNSTGVNLWFDSYRVWGGGLADMVGNESWRVSMTDLSTANWGDGSAQNWDDLIANALTGLLFRPFYNQSADNYFDISFVAFFESTEAANAYEFVFPEEPKATVTFKSGEDTFAEIEVVIGEGLIYPETTPEAPEGKVFVGWDVEEGTTVIEAITVNAVFEDEIEPVEVKVTATDFGSFTVDGGEAVVSYAEQLKPETVITLTAIADTGYRLEGWYEVTDGRNILLSRDTTYVHTVDSDVEIEARFIDETISIAVKLVASTSEGGFISVNGNTFEDYNDYANSGSAVELTAVADTGYTFAYWKRVSCSTGTEIYLGVDETISVYPLGNTVYFTPVFVAEGTTLNLYLDAQELIVSDSEEPAIPSRLGYTGTEWKLMRDGDVVDTYKPEYTRADTETVLTIVYADSTTEEVAFKYDDQISITGTLEDPIWTLTANGVDTIVSYSKDFTFGAAFTGNITLTESENTNGSTAVVNGVEAVYDSGAGLIKFVGMYELPEGATLNERGVLLTNDASVADTMEIDTPNIIVGRVNSDPATATKTFIINKTKVNAGDTWYGRAYIVYTENGETKTLYADTMTGTAE
ncbi:MAG: Ig-like domain-containing protein [Clostridia bacterium]|nr:Ig-like domain-containing protein [Clostridia bacterium]